MTDPAPIVALREADPDQLARAVLAVMTAEPTRARRLHDGARASIEEALAAAAEEAAASARWFQALVELGWLVASADGFDPAERRSMATLLAAVTGEAVDHALLEQHLAELAEQVEIMGRSQRLARAAAELGDLVAAGLAASDDAVTFATLVCLADGRLEAAEHAALVELGGWLALDAAAVRARIAALATEVEARLS